MTDVLVNLRVKGKEPMVNPVLNAISSNDIEAPANDNDLHLYVDCVPVRGITYRFLEDLLPEYLKPILEEHGAPDVRLIPYGEGKGKLAAAVRAVPPRGAVVARRGDVTDAVVEALVPLAKTVVFGVR